MSNKEEQEEIIEKYNKSKASTCLYCLPFMDRTGVKHNCIIDTLGNAKEVTNDICDVCDKHEYKYIQYPLTINGIDTKPINTDGLGHKCGELCEIQPCGEEYKGKTYLGIYIGDLPIQNTISFSEDDGILKVSPLTNPAIYVFELKKIIYGCESWWRKIKSVCDFEGISEENIENTWYVKLLKEM